MDPPRVIVRCVTCLRRDPMSVVAPGRTTLQVLVNTPLNNGDEEILLPESTTSFCLTFPLDHG